MGTRWQSSSCCTHKFAQCIRFALCSTSWPQPEPSEVQVLSRQLPPLFARPADSAIQRSGRGQKLIETKAVHTLLQQPAPTAAASAALAAPAAPAGYKYVNKQQSCQSEMMLQSEPDYSQVAAGSQLRICRKVNNMLNMAHVR